MADHAALMRQFLGKGHKKRVERVTQTFLKMKKFDIGTLQRAAEG